MKSAFDRLNLRPFERRLVVGVATVVFIVLNLVFVWPHFSDRAKTLQDLDAAQSRLTKYEREVAGMPEFQRKVRALESEAEPVPPEDQGLQFLRTIQEHVNRSGVNLMGNSKETIRTNQFFTERNQTITVTATERQLVDFLYNIGAVGSMIRARDLSLRPDAPRQRLNGNIKLVASYQKKAPPKAAPAPVAAKAPADKRAEKPAPKPPDKPAAKPAEKAPAKPAVKPPTQPAPAAAKPGKAPAKAVGPESGTFKPGPAAVKPGAGPPGIPALGSVPSQPRPFTRPDKSTDKQE